MKSVYHIWVLFSAAIEDDCGKIKKAKYNGYKYFIDGSTF